jgi:hypothetical protein
MQKVVGIKFGSSRQEIERLALSHSSGLLVFLISCLISFYLGASEKSSFVIGLGFLAYLSFPCVASASVSNRIRYWGAFKAAALVSCLVVPVNVVVFFLFVLIAKFTSGQLSDAYWVMGTVVAMIGFFFPAFVSFWLLRKKILSMISGG